MAFQQNNENTLSLNVKTDGLIETLNCVACKFLHDLSNQSPRCWKAEYFNAFSEAFPVGLYRIVRDRQSATRRSVVEA